MENSEYANPLINARGHKIDYGYYDWGGLEKVEYYDTATSTHVTRTVRYSYDYNGNITHVSDSAIQGGADLYTFSYDALNRPDTTVVGYLPGVSLKNGYDRYGNRNLFKLTDSSGVAESHFTYNQLNQLSQIKLPGNQNFIPEYYKDAGRLKKLTYPSGITTEYLYEDNGPIKQILTKKSDDSTLEQLDYVYDALLNIKAMASHRDNGTHTYDYDNLDHLIEAVHPESTGLGAEAFAYDKVGNREVPGDLNQYEYNENHQITKSPGVESYTFDVDGSLKTKADGSAFDYNKDNRLARFTKAGVDATYQYDPFGRRISKKVNGIETYFVWDGTAPISEYDPAGLRKKRYAYLPEDFVPIQMEDQAGIYSAHLNHIRVAEFLTDSSQSIVWDQNEKAFGEMSVNQDPDGNAVHVQFDARLPGQWFNSENSTHYNFLRDYDPSVGRYIERDPLGLDAGVNQYVYVTNNPLSIYDPYGLYGILLKFKGCLTDPAGCRKKLCNGLNGAAHATCDTGTGKCKGDDSCTKLKAKKALNQVCLGMRYAVGYCHGRKNDKNPKGHQKQLEEVRNRIKNCERKHKKNKCCGQ